MRKIISISLGALLMALVILLGISKISNNQSVSVTPTPYPVKSLFSKEANETFISAHVSNIDLNSGITMEKAVPLYSDQVNNISFAVFNHADEPIIFSDQGFGLVVFRYDDLNKLWENLQLPYAPYREAKTLPPKLETWDFEINNSWDLLENDTTAFGVERLRLYVSGKGQTTNKIYGAYLDVPISLSP